MYAHSEGDAKTAEHFAIGDQIADRIALAEAHEAAPMREFVMTRAAERAWSAINLQLAAEHGTLFRISGPPVVGNTHFLNYVTALSARGHRGNGRATQPDARARAAESVGKRRNTLRDVRLRKLGARRGRSRLNRRGDLNSTA